VYRRGLVSAVDPATHRVRVTFPDRDGIESPWLEVLVRAAHVAKHQDLPAIGDQVAVLLDEREESGCILGALYSNADKPPSSKGTVRAYHFGDGGVVEYDSETHVMRIVVPENGRVELAGAAEPVALADAVRRELEAIREALDSHTHAAGLLVAPSGGGPVTGTTGTATSGYSPGNVAAKHLRSA